MLQIRQTAADRLPSSRSIVLMHRKSMFAFFGGHLYNCMCIHIYIYIVVRYNIRVYIIFVRYIYHIYIYYLTYIEIH